MAKFYKIFTHDRRSPIQGGEPVWDGSFPFELPKVKLNTSDADCEAGWNFVDNLATGFRIAGLWPDGRPSIAVEIEPASDLIQRGDKWRASGGTLTRLVEENEIQAEVLKLSKAFPGFEKEMYDEQMAWRKALARPRSDRQQVIGGLEVALKTRGLDWKLKEFPNARAAWDAWDARDAWAAWDALTVFYAAKKRWVNRDPYMLTTGIRDAYENGLEIALPTGPNDLGFSMAV